MRTEFVSSGNRRFTSAIFMKNIGPAAENDIAVRDVDYRRNTKWENV
jgi:hypothetical protein